MVHFLKRSLTAKLYKNASDKLWGLLLNPSAFRLIAMCVETQQEPDLYLSKQLSRLNN